MNPLANNSLSLIIISLGVIALILSFLVPDRKKSVLSLVLAVIIMVVGLIQFGKDFTSQMRWKSRMSQLRKERSVDLEELRSKLKARAEKARKEAEKAQP